jgi:hypothetical protein
MPINFDPNSLNGTFDKNFGAGAYNAGLSNAAKTGRLKAQASFAKSDFLKRLSAAQAKAKKDQEYLDKYGMTKDQYDAKKEQDKINKLQDKYQVLDNGLTSDQASKMRAKGDAQGRGGHQPSYDQQRKEAQQNAKSNSDLTSYDTNKMTPHNQELVQKLQEQQLKAQQAQQQQKKSSPGILGSIGNALKGVGSEIGAAATAAEQFINPFDKVSADQAVKNYMNRNQSQGFQEVARGANRAVDSASLGLMSNLDKKLNNRTPYYNSSRPIGQGGGTDMITSGLGYLVPGLGAAKGVKALGLGAKSIPALENGAGLAAKLARGSQVARTVAKEGALVGGALPLAQMGINYAINPKDQNLKENLLNVGLGAGLGAVGDPILRGLGSAGGNMLAKFAKGDVPTFTGNPSQSTLDALMPKLQQGLNGFRQAEQQPLKANISRLPLNQSKVLDNMQALTGIKPKQPKNDIANSPLLMSLNPSKTAEKMNPAKAAEEAKPVPKLTPTEQEYQNELNQAVQQQVDYLKNSMGKGVDRGTTSNGELGNFKEVTGTFNVSRNPKWYQDFYKQTGRKPNKSELEQLAKEHVLGGFQDEHGNIPAYVPKKIQDLNDQIDQVKMYLDELNQQPKSPTNDGYTVYRRDNADAQMNPEQKPHGLYTSLVEDPKKFQSPFEDVGNTDYWFKAKPKKPLVADEMTVQHERFGYRGEGQASAGVAALHKLLPGDIYDAVIHMRKEDLTRMLNEQFPGPDYSRYHDSYELLEVYAAQLAKSQGYDSIILKDSTMPNFSEMTVLKNDILNPFEDPRTSSSTGNQGQIDSLNNLLSALKQDKAIAEDEYNQFLMKLNLQKFGKNEPKNTNINPKPIKNDPTTPNPLDNHGYGLIDLAAEAKAKEPKISPVLQDTARQNTGNADTFNAKISDKPIKDKKSLPENLQTQFVDDAFPAHKYEKAITGQINSAEDSLYKTVRNFRGSPEKAHLIVQEQLAPIFHEMDKAGIKPNDLRNYALAVHAKDVNAKGINSGFTNAEIKDTIDKFGSPKMEELRNKLVGVNDYAMKLLTSGEKPVLDPQKVADLKEKWPNYMSLFRDMNDNKVDFSSGVGKSMVNATSPIKKLEGLSADSQLQTINPMESLIKNVFKAVNTADRNNVSAQVAKLAIKDTEGNFIRQIDPGQDTSRLNVINLMDKGKKVQYEVPPDLYKTLKNLDQESTNTLIKILQKPASMLRAGATLTPEFSLRNPLRDVPNAFITSKSGFNPITDFPVGLMQAVFKGREVKIGNRVFKTPGDLYKQFVKENGGYGNIISMDRQMHQKLLKQALNDHNSHFVDVLDPKTYTSLMKRYANPLNALRNIADISETATKVGEFRAALRSGASPQEAAYRARDTMDFGRAGTSVREANKVVAFLNANIQGKSKLIRAFKENPVRVTGKAVGAVTLPTIGAIIAQNTYANDNQKQIINDAPQWLKDTFYLFPIPGTNQIARIPKPFDLAGAFSNPIERAFDFVAKHDKHAFDSFIKDNLSQASIPVMLTGLAPMVEGMANYSFFKQGPIIPTRESNLNYPDQHDVNTSEVAKGIAKGVNAVTGGQGPFKNFGSPRVIDNTIQGLTGGTGTYVTNAIDWLLNSTGAVNNPQKAAKNIDQQPLAKAFLVNQSSTGQSMDSLYNLKDQLTRDKGSAKQQGKPFTQQMQYNLTNQATKQISKLSGQIRSVENSPVMSADQKREMLDALIKQRNALALQTMQRLNQQ